MRSRVLIVGSGAMACLFGARLAAHGIAVSLLVGWKEARQALEQYGVRLIDEQGRQQAYPVQVFADAQTCPPAVLSLVLVKSWQTRRAAEQLAACLHPQGIAVTLQNGLGNREQLAAVLGTERVAQGVTTNGASLLGPGLVQAGGEGLTSLESDPRLEGLAALLREAGFATEQAADLDGLLWGKLVINAAINPLTALLRLPNGELIRRSGARALMRAVAQEAGTVAAARGVRLPYPDPASAAEAVAWRTAPNRSSMLQDVERGAPTEIDAICGAIVRAGEAVASPTPFNFALWNLVRSLSSDSLPPEPLFFTNQDRGETHT